MKMKYRLTPANSFCLFVLGVVFYAKTNDTDANNLLGLSYVFFFTICVFLVDLFLQFIISDYKKVLIIESVALPIIILISLIS